jgi:hypothetical protein
LHVPDLMQTAISVERQLLFASTLSVTYVNSRGLHTLFTRNIDTLLPGTNLAPYADFGQLAEYEAAGASNQHQIITSVNTRFGSKVAVSTTYSHNDAHKSMADIQPIRTTWRAIMDVPTTTFITMSRWFRRWRRSGISGSVPTWFTIRAAVQIVTETDLNGDNIFNDRPTFATAQGPAVNVRTTSWGAFNMAPQPGELVIPRNQGDGPSTATFHARISKKSGFGPAREGTVRPSGGDGGEYAADEDHAAADLAVDLPGPVSAVGEGVHAGGGSGATTGRKYNLSVSISARFSAESH